MEFGFGCKCCWSLYAYTALFGQVVVCLCDDVNCLCDDVSELFV